MSEYHKIENMSEIEVAYFAGLLDGEGCVRVGKFKNSSGSLRYRAYMVIAMTDAAPIDWLVDRIGGKRYVDRKLRPGNSKICFSWQCNARQGSALLKRAIKHLLVKRSQAENYIAFAETLRMKRLKGDTRAIPIDLLKVREQFANRSMELNKKGAA